MPDRSPPSVDWGTLTPLLRPGDRVCTTHGRVPVAMAPIGIPICSHCGQMTLAARFGPTGVPNRFEEPLPPHCVPEQHPLVGGAVEISWQPCGCEAARLNLNGHRAWRCSACTALGRSTAVLLWPQCSRSAVPGD